MKAIGYRKPGDAKVLEWIDLPEPEPGPRDLVVRVEAVSVNPADCKTRASDGPKEGQPPRILGFDAAGTVVRVGKETILFKPGDAVFYAGSKDRPGTDAELHAVDERLVGRKPTSLSWTEAAALPLTTITAWELLFDRLRVPYGAKMAGGTLLIINGAGGVGSILTQLVRRLTGLTIVATAGNRPEGIAWCQRMGAHHVIDYHRPLDHEMARLGIKQVEYVASLTATDKQLDAIQKVIAPQGTLALIDDPKILDIVPFKSKAVTVAWEFMFTRSSFGTPDMARQGFILNEAAALVDAGVIVTTLTQTLGALSPDTLAEAHRLAESGQSIGKTTLPGIAAS